MYYLDAHRGMREVLGIAPEALPKQFIEALDEAISRDNLVLSPGARLLQGVIIQDSPYGQGERMRMRLRGIAVFLTALEMVGTAWNQESEEPKPLEATENVKVEQPVRADRRSGGTGRNR